MSVDALRHLSIFSPVAFGDKRVDVIGCGATGSKIALGLAKLGIENLHLWDFDTVESHNIANQAFSLADVGQPKVEALARIIKSAVNVDVNVHNERVDGSQKLGEIVYLLPDTMTARKQIWDKALKLKIHVKWVVETRMGPESGRIYAFNPCKPGHMKAWESTLCTDDEAQVSACGASITVGSTADVIAGMAVWQLIRWFAIEQGKAPEGDETLENEIIFSLRPFTTLSRQF